jgi:glycosyltransferase involved in cell wall biosynthesis
MHFVWAGDGTQRRRLAAIVRLRGLGDHVHVVGHVDDMASLVGLCDVFVLPTRRDAAPLALIEAMAAGLAVIATDVGDIASIVGDAGIVLPNPSRTPRESTVHGIAAALSRVCVNAAERERFAARARARADREHRGGLMVDRYDALLRRLL